MKNRPWVLAVLFLFIACARQDPDAATTPVAGSQLDDAAWTQALVDHRDETDEEFRTSTTSPMAGTQRLQSDPADRVYLTRRDRTLALAYAAEPAAEIAVVRGDPGWTWESLGSKVVCEIDGEPVAEGAALDRPATFAVAELHVRLYPSEERVLFTVYDPDRPEKKEFEHLLYFPPDRGYAVPAKLVKLAEPEQIEMLTSRSLKKTFYRYARIQFQLDGEDLELTAFKSTLDGEGSEYLFIPFRDATSGHETYGAGRFLDLDEPQTDDFVLDFNRAYNPLCNYSPGFNCPIPPRENHLDVAIRAGELTYPH
ncbi:MAG: DUF1684 domain-containing protein [Acidobacteria bacterium]|jgi:hypothetical protein|nr:DUF1684 domain-containing protein [Acidobacteriota bacterium]